MNGKSLDLTDITDLLEQVAAGDYEPVDPEQYDDPQASAVIAGINRIHARQDGMVREYNENLGRSEARLRNIIETTPVGICITNKDGIYEYVNPTYCRLYGYRDDELIGKHFTTVVPRDSQEELTRLHDEFMGRRYELRGEWSVVKKDGSPMAIIADAAYIIDIDEQPKKVTFVLDISERKEAEEALRRAVTQLNREKETRERLEQIKVRVERMIRHDLRNPLNGIMAAAEIIMADEIPEEQRDLCRLIRKAGRKLDSMLSSSVDFIKMEEETYLLKPQRMDLANVLQEARRELESAAAQAQVKLVMSADGKELTSGHGLTMEGEHIHLSTLFANLIRNAIEASNPGEVVTVTVTDAPERYTVTVHNRAEIPEEIRDVFFHPYATSGKANGTGLGTYVASLITRVHRGEIAFTTSREEGTTVTVKLPVRQKRAGQSE